MNKRLCVYGSNRDRSGQTGRNPAQVDGRQPAVQHRVATENNLPSGLAQTYVWYCEHIDMSQIRGAATASAVAQRPGSDLHGPASAGPSYSIARNYCEITGEWAHCQGAYSLPAIGKWSALGNRSAHRC